MRFTFNALAEAELRDALMFYETASPGLGERLLDVVQVALTEIDARPTAAPSLQGTVRRKLMREFPYQLLYRQHGDEIRILAVMHLRRRPAYWARRK